jgi:hypothetical protein
VIRRKCVINERCTKMIGSKNDKEFNEKKVLYSISKDQSSESG